MNEAKKASVQNCIILILESCKFGQEAVEVHLAFRQEYHQGTGKDETEGTQNDGCVLSILKQ